MKKTETIKLLTLISANYSRFEINEAKVVLWHELIGDLPFEIASAALKKVMMTSEYPPNIAEIRKAAVNLTTKPEDILDAGEAWREVRRAIGKCGSYGNPAELFSGATYKVVQCMGWRDICMSENIEVTRSNFMKMYGTMQAREEDDRLLPEGFKDQIKHLVDKIKLKQISEG
ncbi:MAG TPA: replicative helicase loader/inhibitor [Clostridiaceae bacterium]